MKPVLALDFDGTICDSLEECLVTAYNTCLQLEGSDTLVTSPIEIAPQVANAFRRLRHFARNAPEIWLIMHWAITDGTDLDQNRYDALASSYDSRLPEIESLFFKVRHYFRSTDPDQWLSLNRMYPEFLDGWEEIKGRFPTHIVTTKDLVSTQLFNRHWDLGIPDENLWTRERGLTKGEIVQRIAVDSGIPIANVMFVDDHPHHVREVAAAGAGSFWAAWGFLGIQEQGPLAGEGNVFTKITRLAELKPYLHL